MSCTRRKIIAQAQQWVGMNEADGSHKKIIDVYNSHKPLARGYKLTYTDAWCAGFVSALAIACDATDIIPTEVGCGKLIELAKKKGIWVEADNYTPSVGDVIVYDWEDNGVGDNKGNPNHVGIVEYVVGDTITVIEGNYKDAVGRRCIRKNGKYIRGFITPHYDEEKPVFVEVEKPAVKKPVQEKPVANIENKQGKRNLFSLIIRAILKFLKGG